MDIEIVERKSNKKKIRKIRDGIVVDGQNSF